MRLEPAPNRAPGPGRDRFEIAPADLVRLEGDADAAGLRILGVWHTHPDRPARPSQRDRESAFEGWSWLIATVTRRGVPDVRSWSLDGEGFSEETLVEQP